MVELSVIFIYFLTKPFLIFCILRIREALLLQEMRAGDGFTWTHLNKKSIVWKESRSSCQRGNKHMTPVLSDCIEDKNLQTEQGLWVSLCAWSALCKEAQSLPPRLLWLHLKIFSPSPHPCLWQSQIWSPLLFLVSFWNIIDLQHYVSSNTKQANISMYFKMITRINLVTLYHHTKILHYYWLYSPHFTFHICYSFVSENGTS